MKNRLKEYCMSVGIENSNQLRTATGISNGTCQNLWKEDHIPSGDIIGEVCRTLNIQPGDWLFYEKEQE